MPRTRPPSPRRVATVLATALAVAALVWLGGIAGERWALDRLGAQAGPRLDLYALGLESELGKYDPLPALLGEDPRVLGLLAAPGDPAAREAANGFLEEVNRYLGASACYVVAPDGMTLAASNWRGPASFVGRDFSYRPYVRDALAEGIGRFYGIGTTSREPGYYVARAIREGGAVLGVAVVKVSLDRLERAWAPAAERVLVRDANGVVVLASDPAWKFKTLAPLSAETLERLRRTRQYDQVLLEPLGWRQAGAVDGGQVLEPGRGERFLALNRTLDEGGWQVTVLYDLTPVSQARVAGMAVAGGASAVLVLMALYGRQRRRTRDALARANQELERKVAERTAALTDANLGLRREVAERERAEQELRRAQDGLVQAAKLAALGQLSAGVAHEINQPLAALRTLSDNAAVFLERGQGRQVAGNLAMIAELTERMAKITGQLRSFARKSDNHPTSVPVAASIAAALALVQERLRRAGVEAGVGVVPADLAAWCDATRLEQVLVNLLANAADAVAGREERRVAVEARAEGGRVLVTVADSGPGLSAEALERLFEPFFTTKGAGAGLGLGLAISAGIAQGFGGSLRAANAPGGGAVFTLELPAAGGQGDVG